MKRRRDSDLPPNVTLKHGAYYWRKGGKWTPLGRDLHQALAELQRLQSMPTNGMPWLIEEAMKDILPRVRGKTVGNYKNMAKRLKAVFAEFRIKDVTPHVVATIKRSMKHKQGTANALLSLLRQIFDLAVDTYQVADSNPVASIRRFKRKTRDRLISMDEYGKIYAHAGPQLRCIMDLCLYSGQRISDVLAIKRSDLTDTGIEFDTHKTGDKITVEWTPELRDAVERAKALCPAVSIGGWLLMSKQRRSLPPAHGTIYALYKKACETGGVDDATLHDLRAMSLTAADAQGLDAQALATHTSRSQTEAYIRARKHKIVQGPSFVLSHDRLRQRDKGA